MKYTLLAMIFVFVCVGFGLRAGARGGRLREPTWLAAVLAAAMVAAQLVLLTS